MSGQLLILAQVDDATGEVLQDVAERLHATGARNIQILASLGKKGRPGQVLLIDVDESLEDEIALVLGIELGLWGYRVLESRHRHFNIENHQRSIAINLGDDRVVMEIRFKRIHKDGRLLGLKVEHDDLVRLRDSLAEHGHRIALPRLRTQVESALRSQVAGDVLRVELNGSET